MIARRLDADNRQCRFTSIQFEAGIRPGFQIRLSDSLLARSRNIRLLHFWLGFVVRFGGVAAG